MLGVFILARLIALRNAISDCVYLSGNIAPKWFKKEIFLMRNVSYKERSICGRWLEKVI